LYFKAIALVVAVQFIIAPFILANQNALQSTVFNLLGMLLMQVAFFVAVLSSGSKPLLRIKERLHCNFKVVMLSLLIWVVAFVAFISTNIYFGMFLQTIGYKSSDLQIVTFSEVILGILTIGIVAPICEELVFRFGMLEGYKCKSNIKAIFLTASAFALMHMNPEQTFYQFFLGAVCAYIAIKTNSIVPSILIHSANNIVSLFLGFSDQFDNTLSDMFGQSWFVIIAIVLFVSGVYLIYRLGVLCQKVMKTDASLSLDTQTQSKLQTVHDEFAKNSFTNSNTNGTVFYICTMVFCVFMWLIVFGTSIA
jgi:membrane protease YdiL (CAAX protease family)